MSAKDLDAIIEMNRDYERITGREAYAYTSDPGDQPKRVVFTDGTVKPGYVQGRAYMAELLAKAVAERDKGKSTEGTLTDAQRAALHDLCKRHNVLFSETEFHPTFDLPAGYVAGWVGSIYVGCSPEGEISS